MNVTGSTRFCLSLCTSFYLALLLVTLQACAPAEVSDRPVHEKGTAHIDTAAYFDGRYHFPGERWTLYDDPGVLGWDASRLEVVGRMVDSLETAGLMVVHRGVLVYDWGATDEEYITQSMRKGLLNSLYGVYWDRGELDLDASLEELGVNDMPPLTAQERQATVEQLLQSTSGVYHSALYEVGSWKRDKPERGTHRPGETWYYNNWGFNALGTIFEELSGRSIGAAFEEEIATPLGMQDFDPDDVSHITRGNIAEWMMGNRSDHPAYMFRTSTRDMARFGLLYLNRGSWSGRRIFSEAWLERSWSPVNIEMYHTLKFGYLWWVFENGVIYVNTEPTFEGDIWFTSGNRGHALFVIPYLDLVVVHRVAARGVDGWSQMRRGVLGAYREVDDSDVYRMLEIIRQAHPRYSGISP